MCYFFFFFNDAPTPVINTSYPTRSLHDALPFLDDPVRPRGLRSRPFDGEGLPTRRSALIDKGVLTGWLLDSASARQLGLTPTGHATRGSGCAPGASRSEEHTSELQSLMRNSYAVFCLKKNKTQSIQHTTH